MRRPSKNLHRLCTQTPLQPPGATTKLVQHVRSFCGSPANRWSAVEFTAKQSIDAAVCAFGRHPGARALHAKGTLLRGTFWATAEAGRLTSAAHMQGDSIPATFRFSKAIPVSPTSSPTSAALR